MDGTANEFFHEGVEVKGYPTLAFFAASPDGKAKIPKYYDGASGDAASFAAWLAKHVKAAKIDTAALDLPKPALKSEPAPTAEEAAASAVVTAVGSTVEALALDPTKDVLLEFYAPWCGHCKALSPVYEALATKLKGRAGYSNVVLAKLDATANDYALDGVKVEGFPTLYFFPAAAKGEKKGAPTLYTSNRDEESFETFLKANAKSVEAGGGGGGGGDNEEDL
jgi:protein disulfide-isomerase-like protein